MPYLQRAVRGDTGFIVAVHSLAELYAVLTRIPTSLRVSPAAARDLIQENVLGAAAIVTLDAADYEAVVKRCAELGLAGGVVYDALIARAAEKAEVDTLLTFNPRDFHRIWPEGADRIQEP